MQNSNISQLTSNRIPVETIKNTISKFTPYDTDKKKIRVGKINDGGYVLLDMFNTNGDGIVYSFGVGSKHDFELDMASRGYTSYMYDHTVNGLKIPKNENLKFKKIGIARKDTKDMRTIETLLKENGHEDRDDIILQCDIEGSEWEIFNGINQDALKCFSQIVIELHWIVDSINGVSTLEGGSLIDTPFKNIEKTAEALSENFTAYHIHGNNYRPALEIDGVVVPSVIEVSFVRNDLVNFTKGTTHYPTSLDSPNKKGVPDFELGTFSWS